MRSAFHMRIMIAVISEYIIVLFVQKKVCLKLLVAQLQSLKNLAGLNPKINYNYLILYK
jgi:hypothetical protein